MADGRWQTEKKPVYRLPSAVYRFLPSAFLFPAPSSLFPFAQNNGAAYENNLTITPSHCVEFGANAQNYFNLIDSGFDCGTVLVFGSTDITLSSTPPISGQVLEYNGSQIAGATAAVDVASGTATLGTAAIASGACAAVVTVTATGVLTTDTIEVGFNGDPSAVTGYGVSSTGAILTIYPFPSSNAVNFKVYNSTSASITPGALTLNWRVAR